MIFSANHNEAFAAFSGDRNPIHFDAHAARVHQLGKPVVFGVACVLGALGAWARGRAFRLGTLSADFFQPVFAGESYELEIAERGSSVRVRALHGQSLVFDVAFDWSPLAVREPWPSTSLQAGARRYTPNSAALDSLLGFYDLSRGQLPWHQLSALAWSSNLVGAGFRGATAIFTSLKFSFLPEASATETSIDELRETLDERFHLAFFEGRGDGVASFRLECRVRPEPVRYRIEDFPSHFPCRDLRGRSVFISGASRGLGSVLALAFGRSGANVFVNYLSGKEEAEAIVKQLGARSWALQGDVADPTACLRMRDFILAQAGSLSFLVNNASLPAKPPPGLSADVAGTNLRMATLPTETFAPLLGRGSTVVFVSSNYAEAPPRGYESYAKSKLEIEAWARRYGKAHPERKVVVLRPRRMSTDQTAASPTPAESAIQVAGELFPSFF